MGVHGFLMICGCPCASQRGSTESFQARRDGSGEGASRTPAFKPAPVCSGVTGNEIENLLEFRYRDFLGHGCPRVSRTCPTTTSTPRT